jgi:hypothetical protein
VCRASCGDATRSVLPPSLPLGKFWRRRRQISAGQCASEGKACALVLGFACACFVFDYGWILFRTRASRTMSKDTVYPDIAQRGMSSAFVNLRRDDTLFAATVHIRRIQCLATGHRYQYPISLIQLLSSSCRGIEDPSNFLRAPKQSGELMRWAHQVCPILKRVCKGVGLAVETR